MFLKKTYSKNHIYLSIVETFRDDGKVKHRTIGHLGRLDELQQNDQIKRLVDSLLRVCDGEKPLQINQLREVDRVNWGASRVYRALWNKFDLDGALISLLKKRRVRFGFSETVFLETISRLASPCSKLKLHKTQGIYNGAEPSQLQHLYRALDILAQGKDYLEEWLFNKNCSLFNMTVDVVFYDVTTFYFESVKPDELKDFGYSKDCKFGEVQVVMGLLIDTEGRPVGFDIYPGKTFEGSTLEAALHKLKNRFQIREVVIVADRGINSKLNLKKVRDAGFHYIVGSRLKKMKQDVQKDVLDLAKYHSTIFEDGTEIRHRVLDYNNVICFQDENDVKQEVTLAERLVCTWTTERAEKDRKDRDRLVQKAHKMLEKGSYKDSSRGARRFIKTTPKVAKASLDDDAIAKEARWDGYYGIQTSHQNLSAQDVANAYRCLWRIEESFRIFKTTLETRPMFHWSPQRIRGHLVLCFIAFLLQRTLELELSSIGNAASPEAIRDAINSLNLSVIEHDGELHYLRSTVADLSTVILRLLKIKIPKPISLPKDF